MALLSFIGIDTGPTFRHLIDYRELHWGWEFWIIWLLIGTGHSDLSLLEEAPRWFAILTVLLFTVGGLSWFSINLP